MPFLRILSTANARPFLLCVSFLAGLSAVIVGQSILALENSAITISHCQRLNIQSIFFLNQAQYLSIPHGRLSSSRLPQYCDELLDAAAVRRLRVLTAEASNPGSREGIIRIYADALSAIEDRDSELKRNLLIALVACNVLVLTIESVSLYVESLESKT